MTGELASSQNVSGDRCLADKLDGEISRKGSFLRWNLTPSYVIHRHPYILLFDAPGARVEVRDVVTGKVCELIEENGMRPLRTSRVGQDVLAVGPKGVLQLVEVSSTCH